MSEIELLQQISDQIAVLSAFVQFWFYAFFVVCVFYFGYWFLVDFFIKFSSFYLLFYDTNCFLNKY